MPDSISESASKSQVSSPSRLRKKRPCLSTLVLSTLFPVLVAVLAFHLDSFQPGPIPIHELTQSPMSVSLRNDRMLEGAEFVGSGELLGPEDLAYDSKSQLIYTGCQDGWVKRVRLNDSAVDKWVNTHGRPLGVALGHNGEAIVADGYKRWRNRDANGRGGRAEIQNYRRSRCSTECVWDVLEGKPHGRFMSFDPITRKTRVLVADLYFPNGVAVSPSQDSVILCETVMRRCRKYYTEGNKQGELESFVDNLPGLPDSIKYDGDGHYWIALATGNSAVFDLAMRHAFIRKIMGMMEKYIGGLPKGNDAGVLVVDMEGDPVAHYYDHKLCSVTSAMKIGNRVYCGSVVYSHIMSLDLDQYPASPTVSV
ncbi:hypothetical protein V6N13_044885 [Hibiscus sabdariffa]|uniref:Strictosidine synthase conserved region domain-containing protein n=1 Tax=Hibiscus sabdariffa TaxID=183260 RepID=A0ABR2RJE5_9ROSI